MTAVSVYLFIGFLSGIGLYSRSLKWPLIAKMITHLMILLMWPLFIAELVKESMGEGDDVEGL